MALESPNIFVTLFAFVILIGSLVVIHELGHYFVGRWFGVKAEKFSVGFGPQIWGRVDKRGTLWRVGALPLGGYVQFAGDMNPASQPGDEWLALPEEQRNQTFQSKTLLQRALIVFAGPAINFIFAIILLSGLMMYLGTSVTPTSVVSVQPGSPAEKAQLQVGDKIVAFNGHAVSSFDELAQEIQIVPNETVSIEIERSGANLTKTITTDVRTEVDRFGNKYRLGLIGIDWPAPKIVAVEWYNAPWLAAKRTADIIRIQIKGIGQIISGRRSIKELGGPLKIAKISGEAMALGVIAFISLAAMISINLGFMNLLPIPMLDGGHLMLYAVEAVRRRPATPMVQEWAFRAGFAMLVGFMLMVTFNDIASFGLFGS